MFDLINNLMKLLESVIDYPRESLDLQVWNLTEGGEYEINPSVKRKIMQTLGTYSDVPEIHTLADEIHIVGSICTNQYVENTDIDVHLVVPKDSVYYNDEEFQEEVHKWFKEEGNKQYVGEHPIEVYIQFNPNQELMSDGVYDLVSDKWIKGPKVVPIDYDPYDDFSDVMDDVRSVVKDIDLMMGELKRDVIDYEVMKKALANLPAKDRGKLHSKIQSKLDEIESDIHELYKERKDLANNRELASQPKTPDEALKSAKLASEWREKNVTFKYIARYHYLSVIKELEDLMNGGIDEEDVMDVKKVIGEV